VVVNVNPLYTPRELEHQLKDSGAKAIVIIENFATTLEQCIAIHRSSMWCCAPWATSLACSRAPWSIWCATSRRWCRPTTCRAPCASMTAIAQGTKAPFKTPAIKGDDVAVLQYTGGTTGVSKGAVLLHRNVIANVLQSEVWNQPVMSKLPKGEQPTGVCAFRSITSSPSRWA
jgi:long-chain acyl-CoA synthetase